MADAFSDLVKNYPSVLQIVKLLIVAGITLVALVIVLWVEKKVFRKVIGKKKSFRLQFWNNLIRVVIIIVAIQFVMMSSPLTQPFGKLVFQSTAIIGAIAGFASQHAIADLICGLILSNSKPFVVGDRIEFEDGTGGIVKELTLRHVVIQKVDTLQLIVPNSKINGMSFVNMSFRTRIRSIHFKFQVGYGTDVEEAIRVIGKAVKESSYSIPGKTGKDGKKEYAPVLFMSFADSALVLETTVYYEPVHPTEIVRSDINVRVKKALDGAGIEIPFNYVNVVLQDDEDGAGDEGTALEEKNGKGDEETALKGRNGKGNVEAASGRKETIAVNVRGGKKRKAIRT